MKIIIGTFSPRRLMVISWRSPFDVFLSTVTHSICYGLVAVDFTPSEFKIVCLLAAAAGVVPMCSLIDVIYGEDDNGGPLAGDNSVQVFLRRIRAKLVDRMPQITITSFYGVGYKLAVAPPYHHVIAQAGEIAA